MAQHPGGRGTPFYYSTSSSTSPLSQSSNSPYYPDADSSNPLSTPDPAMTNYHQPTGDNFFHQPSMSSNVSYPDAMTFPHQPSTSTFTQPQPGSSSLYQSGKLSFDSIFLSSFR